MLDSPVSPGAPSGQFPSTCSIEEALKLLSSFTMSHPNLRSNLSRGDGEPSFRAVDSRRPAPRSRPSTRVNDPRSGRVPAVGSRPSAVRPKIRIDDSRSGPVSAVDSRLAAASSRPSIRLKDPGPGRVSAIDSRPPAAPPRAIDDPGLGRLPLPAIDLRRPRRSRQSTRVDDPGPGRFLAIDSLPSGDRPGPRPASPPRPVDDPVSTDSHRPVPRPRPSIHVEDPRPGRIQAIDSGHPAPRPWPSTRVDDSGSARIQAINSCRPPSRPRPFIRIGSPRVFGSCKPSAPANKELEEAENEIQRLNELCLGEDISHEEYLGYLKQLPDKPGVDTSTKLDNVQLMELNARHASFRTKYYELSQQVSEDKLCYDKLKEDYPASLIEEERSFKLYEEDDNLDWFFHPDYCKLAGLEDYQRLVPRNYGGYEYLCWDEYHKYCHSYQIEQEYIKYCEALSEKLKWMEAYVPNKTPSVKCGMIERRGTYQAIKIATAFVTITGGLAFSGFYEWSQSMRFDVCSRNELDGVYYEIWQRYTNEMKFRDVLDEVYQLNRFPLRQDMMKYALENDRFCFDLEEEFLACTTCLKEFAEDKSQVTEEKAREFIAGALRKKMQKPKFYEDYCRKKIDIARAIGLISS